MNTEDKDDLWDLLGQAKAPAPSPFFSRNVLRAIREEAQEKPGALLWVRTRLEVLRRHWQMTAVTATGACAVAVALVVTFGPSSLHQPDPDLLLVQQVSVSPDYQVISNLDELLDSERNSVWLEASVH